MQCTRHKEKCEWPEVVGSVSGSGSGDMKGKGKVVATLPRASEKKKCIKKSATKVVDSDIKIITKPSNASRSGHALLQRMDHLILAVENLAEAQWYMASACAVSGMAVGTLVDKCNFLGFEGVGPGEEDEEEETDTEAVDQEVVEQEIAELKEVLEPQPSDDKM